MNRFADYPYEASKWDAWLVPKVPAVQIGTIPEVVPGLAVALPVTTTLDGQPYDSVTMNYLISNPATGEILFQGAPTRTAAGTWQVALTAEQTSALLPGTYNVQIVAVGTEAAVPALATKSFVAIPQLAFFERLLGQVQADLQSSLDAAQQSADDANARADSALSQAQSLSGLLTIAVGIAVVAVIISVVSIAMILRRMGGRGGMPGKSGEAPTKESEEL
ncbi:MAG: hypothetical protein A3K68_01660 [Euryarchaeota archaeon RBG_16_68_13]|nr:MAG: hypothetical protein A3K68_01660 [Euryarchaeota archaeon RBG_16_68_13]